MIKFLVKTLTTNFNFNKMSFIKMVKISGQIVSILTTNLYKINSHTKARAQQLKKT